MNPETVIKGGHLWYKRERLIEGWSGSIPREDANKADKALRDLVGLYPPEVRARAIASIHPTLLGEMFNALLDAVLVLSYPSRPCGVGMNGVEPHHGHDGRISCQVASLAESFRTPYI